MKSWNLLLLAVVLVAPGCCHLRQYPTARAPQPLSEDVLAQVAYARPDRCVCQETNIETSARYSVDRVTVNLSVHGSGDGRTIALDCFRPAGGGVQPVILILPILGGSYPLEHHFARYFARHGFTAVLLRREKMKDFQRLEEIGAMFRQSILDARLALDWIETRPELDPNRIGLFGVSMGAIRGALLMPLDRRIRAAALGMPGGDLPWIIAHSRQHGLMKRREAYLAQEHLTESELAERLKPVMTLDPLSVAPAVDPGKVLLVLGAFDTNVPFKKGWELREQMGRPETLLLPSGHYTALLFLPYIKLACRQFFEEKLALPANGAHAVAGSSPQRAQSPASRTR